MKFKVLYDGETGILINRNGEIKSINGPKRVRTSHFYKLNNYALILNYFLKSFSYY